MEPQFSVVQAGLQYPYISHPQATFIQHPWPRAVDHKTVQKDIDIEGRFRRMSSVAEEG